MVSLGLETDAKSFQKANDAVKSVRDGVLQLAAAAGTGIGFKALTSDLSGYVLEMNRLSQITGFTVTQIKSLEFAMRRVGGNPQSAHQLTQQIKDWQYKAEEGRLGEKSYYNGAFNPTEFAGLAKADPMKAIEYLIGGYEKMNQKQRSNLREGLGIGENSDVTRLIESGSAWHKESIRMAEEIVKPFSPELSKNAQEFNTEMAKLATNFKELSISMGEDLLPIINGLLSAVNEFIKENPEVAKAILTAAGVGGVAAGLSVGGKLLGFGGGVAAAGSTMGGLAIPIFAAVTPGNAFVDGDDARAMSDPRRNWEKRNPGVPYPSSGVTPEQAMLNQQVNRVNQPPANVSELFSRIEEQRGLPKGTINAIYQAESSGGKNLVSSAGALGPFQFMPDTAKDMGLQGNDVFDLEKSAEAAGKYMEQLLRRYGGDIHSALPA